MKKLLFILLFPTLFFSCIPMEKVTSDEYLNIRIYNRLSQPLSAYFSFDVDDNKGCSNKRDSVYPDSIVQMYGIGFDEEIRDKAFSVLKDRFHNKHLLILNLDGDTLANWTDTSFVFCDHQYWSIDTNTGNNFIHCTLQLTDEVLKLK